MGEMKESARPAANNRVRKPHLYILMIFLKFWLALIIFALPLLFVPSLFDAYVLPKTVLLLGGTLIGWLIYFGGKFFKKEKVDLIIPRWFWPAFLLAVLFVVSSLLQPTTAMRVNALTGKTAIIFAGTLLALLIAQLPTTNYYLPFIVSSLLLALIAIFQYAGLLAKWIAWSPLKQTTWTPTGSILTTLAFILVAIVYLITKLIKNIRGNQLAIGANLSILAFLIILILGEILGILALIESKPLLISPTVAWVVVVEGFKTAKTALLGIGPGNFPVAYQRFRPMTINNTPAWNFYFNSSFGEYLNLLTEVGILGLVALVWIILKAFFSNSKAIQQCNNVTMISLFFLALFIPFDISLWVLFFVLLGTRDRGEGASSRSFSSPQALLTLLAPLILLGWWYGRALWADALFARSLEAFNRGEGGNAYNLQIKALEKNPNIDVYHLAYANTNLALANSLSQQPDLSDQDKQQVTILIQQAIREAKAATAINPLLSSNWQGLAGVYRQIIGVAQGADQWALEALRQAVVLDPINPNLRVDLGGMFYGQSDYDSAQRQFEIAVDLKPDHVNAHYNLAAAYKAQEKWEKAVVEMKTVLSLVEPDSADFEKAKQELEELEAKLPKEEEPAVVEEGTGGQLQEPQLLPTPQVSPIELPLEEAAPDTSVGLEEEITPVSQPTQTLETTPGGQ
ncbi:hypothetical protein COT63_02085 [Candidatus Shapirobacteria bacterium CG09_land_8_20_14_0_10_38_17]|uniref:Uncharacterized protein n=1 Tax=Candidatus Shapirobacteria bacterium CG09_land_8_20_14_0_10_38_17 TaxID=1974884 RepID=A0A2H0WSY4_9BACT|nr:MAG: hypothetical protein COT63_02085 [Candidatus Shapirobacteria bacterium CG09_land_8_20_14_0_10_38_17]